MFADSCWKLHGPNARRRSWTTLTSFGLQASHHRSAAVDCLCCKPSACRSARTFSTPITLGRPIRRATGIRREQPSTARCVRAISCAAGFGCARAHSRTRTHGGR